VGPLVRRTTPLAAASGRRERGERCRAGHDTYEMIRWMIHDLRALTREASADVRSHGVQYLVAAVVVAVVLVGIVLASPPRWRTVVGWVVVVPALSLALTTPLRRAMAVLGANDDET
jgi:hypothetical protein